MSNIALHPRAKEHLEPRDYSRIIIMRARSNRQPAYAWIRAGGFASALGEPMDVIIDRIARGLYDQVRASYPRADYYRGDWRPLREPAFANGNRDEHCLFALEPPDALLMLTRQEFANLFVTAVRRRAELHKDWRVVELYS